MKKVLFLAICIFCILQNSKAQKLTVEYDCYRDKSTFIIMNEGHNKTDSVILVFEKNQTLEYPKPVKGYDVVMISRPKCLGELRGIYWFVDGERYFRDLYIKPAK